MIPESRHLGRRETESDLTYSESRCCHCGRPITFSQQHTFEGVCEDAKCRFIQVKSWAEKKRIDDAKRLQERRAVAVSACEDQMRTELGSQYSANQVFPVPAMQRELVVLPAVRRSAFVDHLSTSVEESYRENEDSLLDDDEQDLEELEIQASDPLPILSAACGTCRGGCCYNGGTHAFVSKKLIDRTRRLNPELTPSGLIELYLSYLPKLSFDDSCVYHLDTGCALPRILRAELCNSFECEDLQFIRERSNASSALLVAINSDTAIRIAKFIPTGADQTSASSMDDR